MKKIKKKPPKLFQEKQKIHQVLHV